MIKNHLNGYDMEIRNIKEALKYAAKCYPPGTTFHPIISSDSNYKGNGTISSTIFKVQEGCEFVYKEHEKIIRLLNVDPNSKSKGLNREKIDAGNIYAHGKWAKVIDSPNRKPEREKRLIDKLLKDIERLTSTVIPINYKNV